MMWRKESPLWINFPDPKSRTKQNKVAGRMIGLYRPFQQTVPVGTPFQQCRNCGDQFKPSVGQKIDFQPNPALSAGVASLTPLSRNNGQCEGERFLSS
ncbi:hypothetical protein RRG08_039447 [Elysia crispata]|uniref:Uncharacterized protein n=1 Tax=Elysia crispata TaxID=231223 RepID=A0AAE1AC01_9GAST|nr:hypothetical protein RRG08_039447 [Elysia crispata]